jgi:hypothetical protein
MAMIYITNKQVNNCELANILKKYFSKLPDFKQDVMKNWL